MQAVNLTFLSIRQPLADLIMQGRKPVENRSWNWMKERDWETEGPVLLGIHASSNKSDWSNLREEERDRDIPGWRSGDVPVFGCVIGVVDLVRICRAHELPATLRKHRSVIHDPDNWCWVLENPRKLRKPFPAKGQARLRKVDVPSNLMP